MKNPAILAYMITRPISPEDYEHYYSAVVLKLAYLLSKKTSEEFSSMGHSYRTKWLNRASNMTAELFNDKGVAEVLPLLAKNLTARMA